MDMLTIIAEADILVPNDVPVANKVVALNGFNQDFFNVVKIPIFQGFTTMKGVGSYILNNAIRFKNIEVVYCGIIKYKRLEDSTPHPMENVYYFNDATYELGLRPAPYANDLAGLIRFSRISSTTFTVGNLEKSPDAPEEYHWTFIPALASFIANTQDDAVKASNYENQYKAAWNVAAQNYAKEVTQ